MSGQVQTQNELDKVTSIVMYYFVSALNGVLGRTHLQKLMFLTDLLASKKFGEPITKMNYVRYTHGPYSRDLDSYIQKLVSSDLIEERAFPMLSNPANTYSRFYLKQVVDAKDYLIKEIGAEKMLMVDEVAQSYGNKSLQEVLDFVYSLEEVKDADFDSPIKMAQEITSETPEEEAENSPF